MQKVNHSFQFFFSVQQKTTLPRIVMDGDSQRSQKNKFPNALNEN